MAALAATVGALVVPVVAPDVAHAAGVVTEYTAGLTPSSAPVNIAAGPDGNRWFTLNEIDAIGRITPAGVITEFTEGISEDAGVWDIAAGPDGNLWFTGRGKDPTNVARIGRITPAGVVTEFTAGLSPSSRPIGITAGPDGAMWFTELLGNRVGRITTAGVITEITMPTDVSDPTEIVTGPDGNLWVTQFSVDSIARITPAGVVTEFPLPHPPVGEDEEEEHSGPQGITAGPDGNLWFTESDTRRIGRMTPDGVVTEFPLTTLNAIPTAITTGPDGNLWFTEYLAKSVGRITTGGVITEFSDGLTAGNFPYSIVSGADGNVWFTSFGPGNRISKITTGPDTGGPVSRFFGVQPKRLLDSRDGTGGFATAWGSGTTRDLTVTGGTTTVPADATSVVLNVTGVQPSQQTHVTLWPSGEPQPDASNINLPPGSVRPNLAVVKVGADGKISIFNNAGTIHLLADVVGYFAEDDAGVLYNGLTPRRILDTRDGTGGYSTPWGAQTQPVVVAGGTTTVPAGAAAVMLNVTVTNPTATSHLTLWPAGQPKPDSSNLNFSAGETVANAVVVKVGANNQISLSNNSGATNVIADVMGYYTGSGGVFTPMSPHRLLDSRDGTGSPATPWGAAQTRAVAVSGGATTVPASATAVVLNLTGVNPSAVTHVSGWPAGIPMPVASNLNLPAGDVRANLAVVKIGSAHQISLFNNAGAVDILGDVVGYYE